MSRLTLQKENNMKKIATRVVNMMLTYNIIAEDMREVYQYGVEILLSSLFTTSVILLIASQTDTLITGIWYLVVSVPLKATVGGYHASTYTKCFLFSTLEYLIQSLLVHMLTCLSLPSYQWCVLYVCSVLYIYTHAPVKNIHHPISERLLQKNRICAVFFLCSDTLALIILYALHKKRFAYWTIATMFMIAVFILPAQRKEMRT